MQICAVQNNSNTAFKAGLTPQMKKAERVLLEFMRRGYKSQTRMATYRYVDGYKYRNHYHLYLAKLKEKEMSCIVNLQRAYLERMIYSNRKEEARLLEQLVNITKTANCGESAVICSNMLKRAGIDCQVRFDEFGDHMFTLVGDMSKFNNYKTQGKAVFIPDVWTQKLYRSINSAYVDFKRGFSPDKDGYGVGYENILYEQLDFSHPKENPIKTYFHNLIIKMQLKSAAKKVHKYFAEYKKQHIKDEYKKIPPQNEAQIEREMEELYDEAKYLFFPNYGSNPNSLIEKLQTFYYSHIKTSPKKRASKK